jgi:hypothetical protein
MEGIRSVVNRQWKWDCLPCAPLHPVHEILGLEGKRLLDLKILSGREGEVHQLSEGALMYAEDLLEDLWGGGGVFVLIRHGSVECFRMDSNGYVSCVFNHDEGEVD